MKINGRAPQEAETACTQGPVSAGTWSVKRGRRSVWLSQRSETVQTDIRAGGREQRAQGYTGLGEEQCGKIKKSLEDFKQGSDETECSFLKDLIGFFIENSFWGDRVKAGRPGRRLLQGLR